MINLDGLEMIAVLVVMGLFIKVLEQFGLFDPVGGEVRICRFLRVPAVVRVRCLVTPATAGSETLPCESLYSPYPTSLCLRP
ncbi:hypothetical protein Baya_9647 [Bagarius yarrelli]|uniref:Uncharacterized protein n=1 Tax=Bagarius yarrelli TaxID=175774 RepID=A0A556UXS6_BAGYA|nr:hypothetical protein Baya_9647 [Bagarius yarrelli]